MDLQLLPDLISVVSFLPVCTMQWYCWLLQPVQAHDGLWMSHEAVMWPTWLGAFTCSSGIVDPAQHRCPCTPNLAGFVQL